MEAPARTPRHAAVSDRALWAIRLLAVAALALSGYLLWQGLTHDAAPGCGAGSNCDYVLGSRWSRWLGVPVGGLAALAHAGVLLASFAAGPAAVPGRRRAAWLLMLLLTSAAAGAAAWFLFLQVHVLQTLCAYCTADHACAWPSGAWWVGRASAGPRSRPGGPGRCDPWPRRPWSFSVSAPPALSR